MTIRKRCNEGSCANARKCLEHLRFDLMWRGKRYRMPANDFAIPRMDPGKQRPIQSMEEALAATHGDAASLTVPGSSTRPESGAA